MSFGSSDRFAQRIHRIGRSDLGCTRHLDQIGKIVMLQGTVDDIDSLVAAFGRTNKLSPSAEHVAECHGAERIRIERGCVKGRDRGLEDDMLETAMLKVWSTERLWTIVNDAFQIYGGAAYFCDRPLERMLRDARINQIGEGANEVLTSFISLVGMREPGERLRSVWEAQHHPWRGRETLGRFVSEEISQKFNRPAVPVQSPVLVPHAVALSRLIHSFGLTAKKSLIRDREEILERQLVQEPIAEAAMELFASSCVLARLDADRGAGLQPAANLFLYQSARRVREALWRLRDNDNAAIEETARAVL